MYPRKKLCLSNETMESDSISTTGIFVISIGLIFIALVFGGWGATTAIGGNDKPSFSQIEGKSLEKPFSNLDTSQVVAGFGLNDVSIAEECDWFDADVEAGLITVCDWNFPDTLPVCITND
jgi:hypothetical protein